MFQSSLGATLETFMHYSCQGSAENFLIIPPEQQQLLDSIPGWDVVPTANEINDYALPKRWSQRHSVEQFSPTTTKLLKRLKNNTSNLHLPRKCNSLSNVNQIDETSHQKLHSESSIEECVPMLCSDLIARHCRSLPNIAITLQRKSSTSFPGLKRIYSLLEKTKQHISHQKEQLLEPSRNRLLEVSRSGSPSDRNILKRALKHSTLVRNQSATAHGSTSVVDSLLPHVSSSSSQRSETDTMLGTMMNLTYTIDPHQTSRNSQINLPHCTSYRIGEETQRTCIGIVNNKFTLSGTSLHSPASKNRSVTPLSQGAQQANQQEIHVSHQTIPKIVVSENQSDMKLENSYELFNSQEDQVPSSQLSTRSMPVLGRTQSFRTARQNEAIEVIDLGGTVQNNNTNVRTSTYTRTVEPCPNTSALNFENRLSRSLFKFKLSQIRKMGNVICEIYK